MNKAAIKAELRRSACEEINPWNCGMGAFCAALDFLDYSEGESFEALKNRANRRTFFLLVAEAL